MDLCRDTIIMDTADLLYSNEKYISHFLNLFTKMDFSDYFCFNGEDIQYIGNCDNHEYILNRFAYFLKSENPILRRSFFVALRNQFDYREFFSLEERRDFFQFLELLEIDYSVITRRQNSDKNYPDFILDNKIGIEVIHHKDRISGQFYKFLYPHKKEYMVCKDLVNHMGKNAELLFKRIRPTICNGNIFAWSEPLSNVYTVDYAYKMLIKRIESKLAKYNKLHYEVFEENILLARIYFDLNEDNLLKLREKLNSDYPHILSTYHLKIITLSDYSITQLSLSDGNISIKKY